MIVNEDLTRRYLRWGVGRDLFRERSEIEPEELRRALERAMAELSYPDPWLAAMGYGGSAQVGHFHETYDPAVKELISLWDDPDDAADFIVQVIADGMEEAPGAVPARTRHRAEYWMGRLRQSFPDALAQAVMPAVYWRFRSAGMIEASLMMLDRMIDRYPARPETLKAVEDIVLGLDDLFEAGGDMAMAPEWAPLKTGNVALYLTNLYLEEPERVWPLVRAFWSGVLCLPGPIPAAFESMWVHCRGEPDRKIIGETALARMPPAMFFGGEDICRFVDVHLADHGGGLPVSDLVRLMDKGDRAFQDLVLFWMLCHHPDDRGALDAAMTVVTGDPDPERRLWAFSVVFFFCHQVVAAARPLVEAAQADPENAQAFARILNGSAGNGKIAPMSKAWNDRHPTGSGNAMRRARVFADTCRKAGIGTVAEPGRDLRHRFVELFEDIKSGDVATTVMQRFAYFSVGGALRDAAGQDPHYAGFDRALHRRLEDIAWTDAAAIAEWLETALAAVLDRFGLFDAPKRFLIAVERHAPVGDMAGETFEDRQFQEWAPMFVMLEICLDDMRGSVPQGRSEPVPSVAITRRVAAQAFFLLLDRQADSPGQAVARAIAATRQEMSLR